MEAPRELRATITGYDGSSYQSNDLDRQRERRQEGYDLIGQLGRGISGVAQLDPGYVFTLKESGIETTLGTYRVTEVVHRSEEAPALADGSEREPYHNRFLCIPYERKHRPERRTLKPTIAVERDRVLRVQGSLKREIGGDTVNNLGGDQITDVSGSIISEIKWNNSIKN